MVGTGSDEGERSNPGGVSSHPDEAGHPMAVGSMAAVAGSGEAGKGASRVAVPAGELGRAGEAFPLGTRRALESADVHAESTGEPAKEAGEASVGPVTSAEVLAGLVVGRGDAEADPVGADSAAVAEGVASPAGTDEGGAEVVSDSATLAAAPPQEVGGRVESGLPPKPRRISKPMLAAAAIAGVVLTSVPFALDGLGGHGNPRGTGAEAAAFSSSGSSSSGFVPSAEAGIPMPPTGVVAPPEAQPPAAQPPAADAPAPGHASAAAAPGPAAPGSAKPAPAGQGAVAPAPAGQGVVAPAPAGQGAVAPAPAGPPSPPAVGTTVVVQATRAFLPGDSVQNGLRRLIMQNDGNLVIYDQNNHPLWSSNTAGRGYQAVFQADGNFVVYTRDGKPVWQPQPGTAGHNGAILVLQGDGNVTISYQGTVVWAANTAR